MATDLAPDWILKQALDAQRKANTAWVNSKPELDDGGLILTVLGCGTMGTAILSGILQHYESESSVLQQPSRASSTPSEDTPSRLPSKFIAYVRTRGSAKRVRAELGKYNARLQVHETEDLGPVKTGDIILLCCKPQQVGDVLGTEGIRDALAGKLLISICAGLSESQIHDILYGSRSVGVEKCAIVCAIPNIAAAVRESMTFISTDTSLPVEWWELTTWIFTRIGKVMHLPSSAMDACTALCGSGPALVAVMVESMAAGAIAMGLPREEAYTMVAQTVRGTADMLLQGEHPAILRDKVSTLGGCTSGGLEALEEGMVRRTIVKAVREATLAASQLGQKEQNVNRDGV